MRFWEDTARYIVSHERFFSLGLRMSYTVVMNEAFREHVPKPVAVPLQTIAGEIVWLTPAPGVNVNAFMKEAEEQGYFPLSPGQHPPQRIEPSDNDIEGEFRVVN